MTDSPTPPPLSAEAPRIDESLVSYTNVIYALHSLSVLIGLLSFHTVIGMFIWGLPSIVAVIMNYARRSATHGTYLESHFRWQIRTFWFAVLWSLVIAAVAIPLVLILIGIPILIGGYYALAIWIIYRVARGWLALRDRRPMYV
ncbi:MAG TPA: hypothetical protein VGR80_05905 [Steroidobacteraceae bacterium]|nr:hypothetical protein [Steroidobacteraceae bacterium]